MKTNEYMAMRAITVSEESLHVIKILFGYRKVRYKGLAKNQAQLFTLFALGNLVLAGRGQRHADGVSVS
jgi:transposase, IS5 family